MQGNSNTYHFYGPEDIKRYLDAGMNAQEMHDMEKAALKDPLLADAIDGFRNADASVTHKHLNDIRAAILGTAEKENVVVGMPQRTPVKWWRWTVAACTLGLLAGSVWWFTQKQNNMVPATPIANISREVSPAATAQPAAETGKPAEPAISKAAPETPAKNTATKRIRKPAAILKENHTSIAATKPPKHEETALKMTAAEISLADEAPGIPKDATAAAMNRPQQKQFAYMHVSAAQPVNYLLGKVTDQQGNPLPSATVSAATDKMLTKSDGSFMLPTRDSSLKVSVDMAGYKSVVTTLTPARRNNIVLTEAKADSNEIVVIGYGRKKQKALTGSVGDYRKFQKQTEKAWKNEIIYPEEGWAHFYEELGTGLGVDQSKATKTLQIKFTVDDNGDPVDFEIVESPDEILAKKAIEMIRKTKWKNFKLDKNAVVKIEVN
ncbi:MAG TPA: carboxypeptidase regulatory-like domain-containing protein [Niabella sp.]|nr:carboxypeptidase regulatory-like domain-containing protein [Niabella sp.]